MKTVYIFFGEMGCGKSYCASHFAEKHGYHFFEGDSVITPRMKERVANFKPLTRDMIEEYIEALSNAIVDKMQEYEYLVVAQALYINEDREALKLFLESFGCRVRMWLVKVSFWRNIQNLLQRDKPWSWVYYWLINKPFFQKPKHEYQVYPNLYG